MFDKTRNRPRPHWKTAALGTVLGAAVVAGGLFAIALALAPLSPMELDGNANDDAGNGTDWATELPLNGPGETFIIDQNPPLSSETGFTGGGSKDDTDVPKWGVTTVSTVTPNKDNITNAYAKATLDDNGHLVVYFGADRFDDEGAAAMGFWFFKNKVGVSGNGFTGTHTDQDILVQVDYVNGGSVAEVQIFKWQSDGTGTHGSPKKVLKEIGFGSGSANAVVCNSSGVAPNSACISTNNSLIDAFWPYVPADPTPAGKMPTRVFIEGAIDITALIGPVCISSFMAETRTTHSETGQLKDFALGDFSLCSIKATNKDCDTVAGVSPVYDSVTDLYQTRHTFSIQNGFGPVYDVQIQDPAVGAGTTCDIVQINGLSVTSIPIPNGSDWVQVADNLAGGASMTVGILCQSETNPLVNIAKVRASATDGGPPITADADDMASESGSDADVLACKLNLTPLLSVDKACKGISLNPTTFVPQVCATVSVTNPVASKQWIDISSAVNYKGVLGVNSPNHDDILDAFKTANGNSLVLQNTGTPVTFDICYTPSSTDNNATNPSEVFFSDTVEVKGIGRASDGEASDTGSASCKLCPACPDCPAP